ncbi:MAG: excinuclease ABC subunit UvrC [Mariprofundaceae bacterium]
MWITPPVELNRLPREPGVYRMLDDSHKVLYVGKARNLRKRVTSYFQRRPDSPRTQAMVTQVHDIDVTITASEAEALILEHNQIKQLKPRYNVLLKDSKTYPYILLTDEDFPRLRLYRGNKHEAGEYFGPFPHAGAVHETLQFLQKVFHIRDCENSQFNHRSRPCMQHQIGRCTAPCCGIVSQEHYRNQASEVRDFLKGKNGQLLERWEEKMQQESELYRFEQAAALRDRIRALRTILAENCGIGLPENADALIVIRQSEGVNVTIGVRRTGRDLGTHLVRVSQAEQADDLEILQSLMIERYRTETMPDEIIIQSDHQVVEELQRMARLLQPNRRTIIKSPKRGARLQWMKAISHSGLQTIAARSAHNQESAFEAIRELLNLPETPVRIAAVDNAHLGGTELVAAITFANWQGADKDAYRRYKLQGVKAGDDYAAMQQVLSRFFRAIAEGELPCPDLMLIDGGKGQLTIAKQVATEYALESLYMVGIAKGKLRKTGHEVLWPSWSGTKHNLIGEPLTPGIHSPALMLMARVRDEAHRFAGQYMRKRKKQHTFKSKLDDINGIGKSKRTVLLKYFGGIEGVKKASRHQLQAVTGVSETLAERIFTALHR